MDNAQLADILTSDKARRAEQADTLIALATAYYNQPDQYHVSRGITGEPSEKNRTYRATETCWARGMKGKTVGIAPGTETISDGTATVAVTMNGVTTIRSAHSFREQKIATRQRRHNESRRVEAECARLAPIGNVE